MTDESAATSTIVLHRDALAFTTRVTGHGPTVLCVHGFPDDASSFRHQERALVDAGYRVVCPTLRGYEPSSIPADGDYHLLRVAEDIVAWAEAQPDARVHLVAHDWGAMAAYAACALAPARFASLCTLAIAHPGRIQRDLLTTRPSQVVKSWYVLFFQLRVVAEWVVRARGFAFIDLLWRRWSPGFTPARADVDHVKATLAAPGVLPAALGYYRALPQTFTDAARTLRRLLKRPIEVPTLALTGARDGCMDTRLHDDLLRDEDFARGLRMVRVPDAGHFLHQEVPEVVNALLLEWLRAHPTERPTSP